VQREIASNAHHADLRHEPDAAREPERARLGLLGRMVSVLCLIEIFSAAPGEDNALDCLGKLIAFRQERRREAKPAPPFVKPFLWIITAGRPSTVLLLLAAVPAEGWPTGVYLSPSNAGASEPGGMLRVGIVVASELPRERATILVRIMAGGTALAAALADLAELPADAYERDVASMDVLELRQALGGKPCRTVEEEDFIVTTRNIMEELRDEGAAIARARDVLTVLRVRGIPAPDAARERIMAEKDPSLLERWIERAIVAVSVAEVLGEPS
jgi:hypothetical protein